MKRLETLRIRPVIVAAAPSWGTKMDESARRSASALPVLLVGAALGAAAAPASFAADFPVKPLRLIAPYGAGGSFDTVARLMANQLTQQLGQTMIVENRPGAAGRIGMEVAVKAPADGYTLFIVGSSQTIVPSVHRKVPYNLEKDVACVSLTATISNTVVVNAAVPANTLAEFVALSKAKPGTIRFGSGGTGGITHLGGEWVKVLTGADLTHVPYKSGALATTAMLAGEVQMNILNLLSALPHIQSGKLKVFGTTSLQRSPQLPNVPTLDEAGAKGYELVEFHSIATQRGAPQAIIDRLNKEIGRALGLPETRERLAQLAAEPRPSTPQECDRYIQAEVAKYSKIVKAVGLNPED